MLKSSQTFFSAGLLDHIAQVAAPRVGGGDRRDGLGDAQALDREIGQQLRPVELGGQGELELTEHMQRGGEGDSAVGQATVGQATVDQAAGSTKLGPGVPVQLDALGKDSGVRAFALRPGGILTPLQRHLPREEMVGLGWIDEDGNPLNPGFKSPEQGAATEVWAATSPQLDGLGGVFCEDCDVAEVSTDDSPGVRPDAIGPASAARLWTIAAEFTGVNAFG